MYAYPYVIIRLPTNTQQMTLSFPRYLVRQFNSRDSYRRLRKEWHITRMFLVIVFGFVSMTTPYAAFYCLMTYWKKYQLNYFIKVWSRFIGSPIHPLV